MSPFPSKAVEWLSTSDLTIDPRVQRTHIRRGHAEQIAASFDPDAFGTLLISRRKDGETVVLDGQHRLMALHIMGWNGDQTVPCEVHDGLSLEQEAKLFRQRNTAVKPNLIDSFYVRLSERETVAVDINSIVREFGWEIPRALEQGTGKISSVDGLESVYTGRGLKVTPKLGHMPEALRLTLQIVTDAWGHDKRAAAGVVIKGIGSVARRDGSLIDQPTLSHRLAALAGGPDRLIGMGRESMYGTTNLTNGIAAAIVHMHNRGKRSRKLSPWPV